MRARKNNARKVTLVLVAAVLVLCCTIGGTLAWLKAATEPVVNTFTAAGIEITLTESEHEEYKLIPDKEYKKDPVVAVDGEKTDIDCYLFVKFEESGNPSTYLDYTSTLNSGNGWTPVAEGSNVWYRIVKKDDTTRSWHLLVGDKITVKTSVTKDNMSSAAAAKLTYTAYAIQYEGFENKAAEAWDEISGNN